MKNSKNITIATLGTNYEMIYEMVGFTNFNDSFDLYKYQQNIKGINEYRKFFEKIDTLYLLSTDLNDENISNLKKLCTNINIYFSSKDISIKKIEIFLLNNTYDINNVQNEIAFQNLVYYAYIKAIIECKFNNVPGKIYTCIAAGRKTMSSDLQKAAFLFGCDGNFHILGSSNKRLNTDDIKNSSFFCDIDIKLKDYFQDFMPVYLGKYPSNEIIKDSEIINRFESIGKQLKNDRYIEPVNNNPGIILHYFPSEIFNNENLATLIQNRFESTFLYYSNSISTTDDCFRELFNYKKELIDKLKNHYIGFDIKNKEKDLKLLRNLPKTDLHCHLGGSLNAKDLIDLTSYVIEKDGLSNTFRQYNYPANIEEYEKLFKQFKGVKNYVHCNKSNLIFNFINMFEGNEKKLKKWIYEKIYTFNSLESEKENIIKVFDDGNIDETSFKGIGIDRYETLGDLQGTTILQNKNAIFFCVSRLIDKEVFENVKHIEIRCSPINYTREELNEFDVLETILNAIAEKDQYYREKGKPISLGLILIASRHGKMSDIYRNIEMIDDIFNKKEMNGKYNHNEKKKNYELIYERMEKYFKGFDLAGNENRARPEEFRSAFLRIMDRCPNITIHAGETGDEKDIWQAIYYLNAERIGHGLKLTDSGDLKKKIKDRHIAIELCPSSNYQILNFSDNYFKQNSEDTMKYPLKDYLDYGLRVTINTDNMGISDTNATNELLKAARLSESTCKGLNIWDILKIIKNGFKASFTDHETKRKLIEDAEQNIKNFLKNYIDEFL